MATRTYSPSDFGIGDLFHVIPDATVIGDARSGDLVLWNASASELFGWAAHEAVGMTIEHLVAPELREQHRRGIARFAESDESVLVDSHDPVEVPAVRRDGTRIWVELRLRRLVTAPPDSVYVLAVVRDVTTRRELQSIVAAHLEEAERRSVALRDFFATAAHDLKSPLASVAAALEVASLQDGGLSDVLGIARRHVTHLAALVDDILLAATLEAGAERVRPERVLLVDAVAGTLREGRPVSLDVDDDVAVFADSVHVRRIVGNLIDNAWVHGSPPISVTAVVEDSAVVVRVSDNGIGVPAEMTDRIFEPFTRAATREVPGTGLGLSAVRRLAELNGGAAWFDATAERPTFCARLPRG